MAGQLVLCPDLSTGLIHADVGYIQRAIGLPPSELPPAKICELLGRMMLPATHVPAAPAGGNGGGADGSAEGGVVAVTVPITRSDILHACDVMEDVAIAYSMNKVRRTHRPAARGRGAARRVSRAMQRPRHAPGGAPADHPLSLPPTAVQPQPRLTLVSSSSSCLLLALLPRSLPQIPPVVPFVACHGSQQPLNMVRRLRCSCCCACCCRCCCR